MSKIVFISDIHLGVDHKNAYPDRKAILLERLQAWRAEGIEQLFLLGDIFEFWMEYRDFIPKSEFDFLTEIKLMVDAGVQVHYFAGNHDFNLGEFFEKQLGCQVYSDSAVLELQGQKVVLLHGDGFAASDGKYRAAKKVITHPWSNFLFKLLHPDWGMALARWVGGTSREHHSYGKIDWSEYEESALKLMHETGARFCVNGHVHEARQVQLGEGDFKGQYQGEYLNIGQWFHDPSWLEMVDGEFRICFLKDELTK